MGLSRDGRPQDEAACDVPEILERDGACRGARPALGPQRCASLGNRVRQGVGCQGPESELQADGDEEQENGQDDDQLGRAGTAITPPEPLAAIGGGEAARGMMEPWSETR